MASLSIPNPYTNSAPYDTLEFQGAEQAFVWPPETTEDSAQYGVVEWSAFKAAVKIDKKSKSGAAKPKVSKTGGEGISFSFSMIIVQDDAALESAAPIIDALRPGSGPWALKRQPDAAAVGITDFIVESVEIFPPDNGTKKYTFTCFQVDQDAQKGKGGNVSSTPGESQYAQQYRAEFERQQGIARNLEAAEQERRIIVARQAAALATSEGVDRRAANKMAASLAGANEVDVNNVQPQQPNPPATAQGKI